MTVEQIYRKLKKIAEPHHEYADQLMAFAHWIALEFTAKSYVKADTAAVLKKVTEIKCPVCNSQHLAIYKDVETRLMIEYNDGQVIRVHDPAVSKSLIAATGFCYDCMNIWNIENIEQ